MFRLVYMTFHGEFRGGEEAEHHLHESPWTMTLPLQILGVLSIVGGFLGFPGQLFGRPELNRSSTSWSRSSCRSAAASTPRPTARSTPSTTSRSGSSSGSSCCRSRWPASASGWPTGSTWARTPSSGRRRLAERFPFAYTLLLNKYCVDELYDATVIAGTIGLADLLWEFDARVVDGAVNGTRHATVGSSFLSGIFDLQGGRRRWSTWSRRSTTSPATPSAGSRSASPRATPW